MPVQGQPTEYSVCGTYQESNKHRKWRMKHPGFPEWMYSLTK